MARKTDGHHHIHPIAALVYVGIRHHGAQTNEVFSRPTAPTFSFLGGM
jgi:hypothetical protein